ncbi:hypothetical protein D9613_012844 [Agrocybe pediades]|uniref:Uncharacterized protein n=1 Tax=Agrocybe pediades TaxID=84607 RepID=A0A8H4QVK4_9AGAR|nr:hypothetical protein D9613_012844 [Agrocybe pediades]
MFKLRARPMTGTYFNQSVMTSNNYPELIVHTEVPGINTDSGNSLAPLQRAITHSPNPPSSPHPAIAATSGLNSNSFNVSKQAIQNSHNSTHYTYNYNYFAAEPSIRKPSGASSSTIEEEVYFRKPDDVEENDERDIGATGLRIENNVAEVFTEGPTSLRSRPLQFPDSLSPAATPGGTRGEASNISPQSSARKRSRHTPQELSGWQKSAATTMSGKNGTCQLVALTRKDFRIPHPSISLQAKAFMRSDFFGQDFIIPLWKTSPGLISNSNKTKQQNRVTMIGHVGNFNRDGGFEILFDMFKTEQENREKGFHPPVNFVPYVPADTRMAPLSAFYPFEKDSHEITCGDFYRVEGGATNADNRKHCGYWFQTTESNKPLAGAALPLPDGYTEHVFLLSAIEATQEYFNEQAPSWYRYYSSDITRRSGMLEGCLKLVTTSITAKTCGAATFIKKEKSRTAEIIYANMCRPNPDEDIYQWHRHNMVSTKAGPSRDEMVNQVAEFESQCVAIAVSKIKVKESIISAIAAGLSRSLSSLVSKKSQ